LEQYEDIKRLFKLYLQGGTNPQQEKILFSYLKNNKKNDQDFNDLMSQAWEEQPASRDESSAAAEGLNQIWNKVEQKKQRKDHRFLLLKYAASVILFASAGLGWYSYQKQKTEAVIEWVSKTTGAGEKVKMILPDSSIVYLGSKSKLSWPARFIKGSLRNVRLEGEAFFEVKHDVSSPFIVYAAHLKTQVLGTSFNIYAYPDDQAFSVTVRTGKVAVAEHINGKTKALSILTPGMSLTYQEKSSRYAINTERVEDVKSWTENRFVFHKENLGMMLERLERYYNVHFELKNPDLAGCHFNATFNNKSIKQVMEQLRVMSGNKIKYKINNNKNTIALWGEGCQ